jgi:hypothetical protein
MFRAMLCSFSGGQNCILQHLVSSLSVSGRTVPRLRADSFRQSTAGREGWTILGAQAKPLKWLYLGNRSE